jgi:hypothetical protein
LQGACGATERRQQRHPSTVTTRTVCVVVEFIWASLVSLGKHHCRLWARCHEYAQVLGTILP